ncbi:MAG TPA: hypothetical protein VFE53_07130 [Mucilaginibacter sp.]|nr:hypothetical protein [Mucilaginibacter sp.]
MISGYQSPIEREKALRIALNLQNKQIALDSNYFFGYLDKLDIFGELKLQDSLFITMRKIVQKWPEDTYCTILVGEYYELKGDTISTNKYYSDALSVISFIVDSIGVKNKHYESMQIQRTIALVLSNQSEKAAFIINGLLANAETEQKKNYLRRLLGMDRHSIIYNRRTSVRSSEMVNGVLVIWE